MIYFVALRRESEMSPIPVWERSGEGNTQLKCCDFRWRSEWANVHPCCNATHVTVVRSTGQGNRLLRGPNSSLNTIKIPYKVRHLATDRVFLNAALFRHVLQVGLFVHLQCIFVPKKIQQYSSSAATWTVHNLLVVMIGGREPLPSLEAIGRKSINHRQIRSSQMLS